MARLLACPFCRELFAEGEVEACPDCGVGLRPLWQLAPSVEERQQAQTEWEQTHPADRTLPWRFVGRGRGPVLLFCAGGLGAYLAPWLSMTVPDVREMSGLVLTQARGLWFSGGAVGFFVVFCLVVTRRTISGMRGSRLIAVTLSSAALFQMLILRFSQAPRSVIPVSFEWCWGLYLSAACSLGAMAFGIRLGGRIDDLPADLGHELAPQAEVETSRGHTVH